MLLYKPIVNVTKARPITSGVPQVGILGPLLFVIFINDLPDIIPEGSMAALYADNTKVYRNITSVIDGESLQASP